MLMRLQGLHSRAYDPTCLPPVAPLSVIILKFLNTLQRMRDVGWLLLLRFYLKKKSAVRHQTLMY